METIVMKSLARRLTLRAQDKLACHDGWFALAVLATLLVPVVAFFVYK
jgi:hypothetical protein